MEAKSIMGQPTSATVKKLFALSRNRCAFPNCAIPIVEPLSGKVTGRICHIKAQSQGGPRYDADQTDADRHSFENVLLLCPIHHDVIDCDPDAYTVERLTTMKTSHESGPVLSEPSDEVVSALLAVSNIVTEGSIITSIGQSGGQVAHEITNIHSVFAGSERRALIQVSFSWQEGEPKEKPFVVTNGGDDEARNIQIHPIVLGARSFSFENVGQLLPKRPAVEREPQPDRGGGIYFRTLIDGIEIAVNDHTQELKKGISGEAEPVEQFDQHVRAEQRAIDDFRTIPVTVTFENRQSISTTLRYRLATTMFARLTKAELHFVSEGASGAATALSTTTRDEMDLLARALAHGEIYLMQADQIGHFVRAGSFDYFDEADPALQAQGIEMLETLVLQGLVRHEGGQLYKVTGTGFKRAKAQVQQ
jgi:hypothetical protein